MAPTQSDMNRPRSRYFVILFQSNSPEDVLGYIHPGIVPIIQKQLDEKITTPPAETEIDIWLESPGGDAHSAYKLLIDLRARCKKLRVVIPDTAKSAATLMAIGADEIYMAPAAELGPLDAQIEHPDREGVTISALNVAKALGFIGTFARDFVLRGGRDALRSTNLPRIEVLRELSSFSAALMKPLLAKLDPHLIHRAADQLDITHRYATIVLSNRNLSEEDRKTKCDIDHVADHLVNHYPAHEFVISRSEAKGLALPIRDAESYPHWSGVRDLHTGFHEGLFEMDDTSSVMMTWSEQDLANFFKEEDEDADEHSATKNETGYTVPNGDSDTSEVGDDPKPDSRKPAKQGKEKKP
jgi:Serine dehydrogenase proteinase